MPETAPAHGPCLVNGSLGAPPSQGPWDGQSRARVRQVTLCGTLSVLGKLHIIFLPVLILFENIGGRHPSPWRKRRQK